MTTYIIKVIVCSALFLLAYIVLLEKEKMHRFNRFYLLFSLLSSFFIPTITFKTFAPVTTAPEIIVIKAQVGNAIDNSQQALISAQADYMPGIMLSMYLLITAILLVRLAVNLYAVLFKASGCQIIPFQKAKLVLLNEDVVPHSFLSYIFISKSDYEHKKVEVEILIHELTHVQQKHSYDIIILEIIQALFWLNPFLVFYKKAIRLNHEFLADASVINLHNLSNYQKLLIEKSSNENGSTLATSFNYLITKKRLLMMAKTTSPNVVVLKQLITVGLFAVVILLFSNISYSQQKETNAPKVVDKTPPGKGASQELLAEYDSAILKMFGPVKVLKNGRKVQYYSMKEVDPERMAYIYNQMDNEQRDVRNKDFAYMFKLVTTPPTKREPTLSQLKLWNDPKMYGVWLDDKRINNSELSKYSPADFDLYYESRLAKNAVNYGKHYFQVNLYTKAYYEKQFTNRKTFSRPQGRMMVE